MHKIQLWKTYKNDIVVVDSGGRESGARQRGGSSGWPREASFSLAH
jgi:hypothetical protein